MSAQIIEFPRPRVTTYLVDKRRGRAMRLSESTAKLLARINRGEIITDLGQIDKATKRVLKLLLAKGYVVRGVDYAFPKEKTCWAGALYWEAHADDPSHLMPTCYKFREI